MHPSLHTMLLNQGRIAMPDMKLGDVTIHYEEVGSGPLAYVFCPGLGGDGQGFVEHFSLWHQHFPRVISWDNRGAGQSSQATKYNLPLCAGDLDGLLDKLGVEKAILHGVSWGGVVVQQFALDHLEKCAAIILDSTSSEVNLAASEGWYKRGETARQGTVQQPETQVLPEHLDSYVANARAIAGLREHPFTPRLKHITCPALVVAGGQDATAGVGGSVILSRNLPTSRLEIFQDSGHSVVRHKRDEFLNLTLEFCHGHGII